MTSCRWPCSSPSAFSARMRVDPLLARLADADEDPARERDRELARESNRLEAAGGKLVRRRPVWPTLLCEALGGRLEHDPHRGRDGPEPLELGPRHDPWVQMREEARLLEHEPRAALEVLERRLAAERAKLLAGDLVAQLRLVTEREEGLAAAGGRARPCDLQHLVLRHERALAAPRRPREGAIAADVTAQRRQWDEDLRRVGDERPAPHPLRLREQLVERGVEQLAHAPILACTRSPPAARRNIGAPSRHLPGNDVEV